MNPQPHPHEQHCKFFHRWHLQHDTGANQYYECARCHKRKVERWRHGAYQPIDQTWLDGGDWDTASAWYWGSNEA